MIRGIFVMCRMYGSHVWIPAFAGITMMVLVGCTLEASEPQASPTPTPEPIPTPDPLDLLIIVLGEAESLGVLSDELASLLSDLFIEYLIVPNTGETVEQVMERLSADQPLDLVIAVLREAVALGALSDILSDLLSNLFIEYLIAPVTGETPDTARERLSADWRTAIITCSKGEEVASMEQWAGCIRAAHWKPGRSAYSLADFIMNRNGTKVLDERISSVLGQPVVLERATIEYRARFDNLGTPSNLDLGVFGRAGNESGLFVGLEAKVDEPFGSETVCERYRGAVSYLSRNPRSKAAKRIRGLLSGYFGETAEPCDSKFSDVGYQLLTGVAGTVAVGEDFSVFYVLVFKTDLYDEKKGRENRLDYEKFIAAAGGKSLTQGKGGFAAHEISVAGKRLICIYDYKIIT